MAELHGEGDAYHFVLDGADLASPRDIPVADKPIEMIRQDLEPSPVHTRLTSPYAAYTDEMRRKEKSGGRS